MSRSSRKPTAETAPAKGDAKNRSLSGRKRILFALVPVVLILVGAEIVTRGIGYPLDRSAVHELDFPPPELIGTAFSRDPVLFWRLIPGYDGPWELYKTRYTCERNVNPAELQQRAHRIPGMDYYRTVRWNVNGEGYRGPVADRQKPTILFVGSSVTFGWGVREQDSFPAIIARKLAGSGEKNWSTVNAGVPGYSSYQCRTSLEELLPKFRPRIVVVEVGINDGVFTPSVPDQRMPSLLEENPASRIVDASGLLSAIQTWTSGGSTAIPSGPRPAPNDRFYYTSMYLPGQVRVPEEDFRENIAAIESMAREAKAEVFFVFPGLYNEYGEKTLVKSVQFSHPREIDVVGAFRAAAGSDPADCFLPYDEAHFSVKGHQIAAERIWEKLAAAEALKESAETSK